LSNLAHKTLFFMKTPDTTPRSFCETPAAAALRNSSLRTAIAVFISSAALSLPAQAATINVNSNASLTSAVASANPGDTIVLANGTYAGFTVTRSGTASAPIVIIAANQGSATISSGIVELNKVSYVTLQGLTVTTPGGALTVDQSTSFLKGQDVSVWLEAATNCRVTRCTFKVTDTKSNQWVCLTDACDSDRIDRNEFGPDSVHGSRYVFPSGNATIPGVTPPSDRTSWADGNGPVNPNIFHNIQIDHNYFHDQGSGTAETIVLGALGVTGDYQNTDSTVEDNLFVNCDGDPEVISVKASSNIIRYNTMITCGGEFSLRAGNNNSLYGNFVLAGNKSGSGGVKLYEKNHIIYNNYFQDTNQYPILIGAGDPYTASNFSHAQVFNAMIVFNTVVSANNEGVEMGHEDSTGGALPPTNVIFANNIIQGSAGTLFDVKLTPAGSSPYADNILYPSGSGSPTTGFKVENPQFTTVNGIQKLSSASPAIGAAETSFSELVTDDMDGQPRDSNPDIGADEFSSAPVIRQPLTTADVGPNAPADTPTQVAAPAFSPSAGTYTSAQSVALSTGTSGASIRYTTDGSTPSETNGTVYTGTSVGISSTTTLRAIAYESGLIDSAVTSGTYTINIPQAAAPSFSPAGGTYTSTQIVTITSATGGASIRYTTDGSTPSETAGTIYSSPVSLSSSVKAIAYKAGFTDSSVTSAAYIINISGPPPTLNFEAESLSPVGTGATVSISNDANASGGVVEFLNSTAAGQIMTFTTPSIVAGTYQFQLRYKTNTTRGEHTVKIDGTQVGGTINQYSTTVGYTTVTLGNVTFSSAGIHTIAMTVTGKVSASTQFYITADKFTFVGQ
jgi:poly(beta-D-mannuronate) lyase